MSGFKNRESLIRTRAPRRSRRAAPPPPMFHRRFYSIMKILQVERLYLPSLLQSSKSASSRRVAGAPQVDDISGIKLPTHGYRGKQIPVPPPEMGKLPELLEPPWRYETQRDSLFESGTDYECRIVQRLSPNLFIYYE